MKVDVKKVKKARKFAVMSYLFFVEQLTRDFGANRDSYFEMRFAQLQTTLKMRRGQSD